MLTRALVVAGAAAVATAKLPTVVAHGMGDSCFNPGMQSLTKKISETTGSYATCVKTGKTEPQDTLDGFFVNMDKNVDIFAEKIRNDPQLAGGFNAAGLSQGNSLIRGYIHKYNDPPVNTFLSVHGTVMGVAGFPNCKPSGLLGPACKAIDELLGDAAYFKSTQDVLFQAGYYRDPKRLDSKQYKENSQIAQWNNEGAVFNQTYKDNFIAVKRYAMIKADKDTMVYPNAGEWWGQYAPNSFKEIQNMTETDLYKKDLFGLKTVHEAGKIIFNSTTGNHLQFSDEQLVWWVQNYFLE